MFVYYLALAHINTIMKQMFGKMAGFPYPIYSLVSWDQQTIPQGKGYLYICKNSGPVHAPDHGLSPTRSIDSYIHLISVGMLEL